MKYHRRIIIWCFVMVWVFAATVTYAGVADYLKGAVKTLTEKKGTADGDIVQGLKEALEIGTTRAIEKVSLVDGYYKNPEIKIPLPGAVKKVEKILRVAGYGKYVDAFETSMNRAAERAAPEAQSIFSDSIKEMKFEDAKKILNGRENEATLYFKEKTYEKLEAVFKPIVNKSMSEVGTTRDYQALDAKIKTIPYAGKRSFDLDQYVTDKSLDGLFSMLGKEESKIRKDPAARGTALLKKVFGSK
jgi:hypothetical protein